MGKVPHTNNGVSVYSFLVLNSWTASHKGPYGVWWPVVTVVNVTVDYFYPGG